MKKIMLFLTLLTFASTYHAEPAAEHKIISLENLANSHDYQTLSAQEIYTHLYQDKILKDHETVIIKFFMPKCGECLSVKLPFEKVANEMSEITFYEANCDSFRLEAIADALEIEKVPGFIVIQNGKEMGRFFGSYSYTDLKKEIEAILLNNHPIEMNHD